MVRQIASPSLPRPSQSSQSFSAFPSGPSTKLARTPLKSMDEPQTGYCSIPKSGKGKEKAIGGGEFAMKVVVKAKARPRSSVHASTAGQTPAIRRQSGLPQRLDLEDLDPDADTDAEDTGLRTPPDSQADPLPASALQRSIKARAASRAGSHSRLPTPPATQSLSSIPSLPSQLTPLRPNQRRRSAPLGSPAIPSPNPRARKTARMSTAPPRRVPATAPRPARPAASQPSRRVSASQPIRKRRQSTPVRHDLSQSTSKRVQDNFGSFKGADGFLVKIMKRPVSPDSPGDDPMLLGPGTMKAKSPAVDVGESFSLMDVALPPSSARSSRSFSLAKSRSPSLLRDQAPPSNMGSSTSPGWSLPVPSPRPGPIARARASRSVSFAPAESDKTPTRHAPATTPYEINMDFAADGFDSDSDGDVGGGADDTFVHLRREAELETTPMPDPHADAVGSPERPIELAILDTRVVDLADESHEHSMLGEQSMLADDTYDDIWEDIEDAQGHVSPAQSPTPTLPEDETIEKVDHSDLDDREQQHSSSPQQEMEQELQPTSDDQSQRGVSPIQETLTIRELTPVPALEIRHPSPSLLSPPASSPAPQRQSSQHLSPQPSPRPWMRAITPRLATPVHDLLSPPATNASAMSRSSRSPSRRTPTPAPEIAKTPEKPTSPTVHASITPTPGPSRVKDLSATSEPTTAQTPSRSTPARAQNRWRDPRVAFSDQDILDALESDHLEDHEADESRHDEQLDSAPHAEDLFDDEFDTRLRLRSTSLRHETPSPPQQPAVEGLEVSTLDRYVPSSPSRPERLRSRSKSIRTTTPSPCRKQSPERTPVGVTEPHATLSLVTTPTVPEHVSIATTTPLGSPLNRGRSASPTAQHRRERSPSWPEAESEKGSEHDEQFEGDITAEADPADWIEDQSEGSNQRASDEGSTGAFEDNNDTEDEGNTSGQEEEPVQVQDADRIVVRLVERTVKLETPEPEAQPTVGQDDPPVESMPISTVVEDASTLAYPPESTTPQNSPPKQQATQQAMLPDSDPPVFRFTGGSGKMADLEGLLRRRSQAGSVAGPRSPDNRSPSTSRFSRPTPERTTPVAPPLSSIAQPRSLLEDLQFSGHGSDDVDSYSEDSDDEPLHGSVVEVSSMDPRAAARAAAILKLNHDYIEHGVVPPEGLHRPSEHSRKSIRQSGLGASYLTAHDGDKTRDELLQDAELDILAHRRSSRSVSVATSAAAPTVASDDEDIRLPGSFVFTPGRKRKAKSTRRSLPRSSIPFIEDRSWGVPEWKRLERCYRDERKAWTEEREVKKAGRPSHGGLLSWARRSQVTPKASEWDDMRAVQRFIKHCNLSPESLTGEWEQSVLLLRVQALGRRLSTSPDRGTRDQSSAPASKRARTQSPPPAPSTPARATRATNQPAPPPSTVKRMLSYVFGGLSNSTAHRPVQASQSPPRGPAAKRAVHAAPTEPSEASAVSQLPEMKQSSSVGHALAFSTFSATTSAIYPALHPPLSQRSTAIQALFAPDGAAVARSVSRPVSVPSIRQSSGLGTSLSRSQSVKDLVRSFESQEDLTSLHRVDSRASQSSKR